MESLLPPARTRAGAGGALADGTLASYLLLPPAAYMKVMRQTEVTTLISNWLMTMFILSILIIYREG